MVKVIIDNYLSPDNFKGDTLNVVVIKESQYHETFNQKTNRPESKLRVYIEVEEDELIWTPNQTSQRAVVKELGDETKDWIGAVLVLEKKQKKVGAEMREVIYVKDVIAPAGKENTPKEEQVN